MKKIFILTVTILLINTSSFAQLSKDAWSFGFGATYPRYVTSDVNATEFNYGGYLSIQRHFTENVGLRISAKYNNLEGEYGGNQKVNTTLIGLLFNITYNLAPCSDVSPYFGVGVGPLFFKPSNPPDASFDKFLLDYTLNFSLGTEWKVGDDWKLITELSHNTPATSRIDGQVANSGSQGLLGGHYDTYMNFDLGLQYYFGRGEPSKICALYDGLIDANVDYSKIEEIVKKYANQTKPSDIDYNRIEDIVKKHKSTGVSEVSDDKWVLIGVNFDFNKASLLPESYAVLYNAARILLTNPDVKVEIQGHTDNIGSDAYNKKLSLQRAETVKNFLVAKGVNSSRITTVGVGSSNPVSDNKTADGRALNRRIEFKVKK